MDQKKKTMTEKEKDQPQKGTTYLFYEPNYDINILENENYLDRI